MATSCFDLEDVIGHLTVTIEYNIANNVDVPLLYALKRSDIQTWVRRNISTRLEHVMESPANCLLKLLHKV
eukprot:4595119-Amphidinium_carterae.1